MDNGDTHKGQKPRSGKKVGKMLSAEQVDALLRKEAEEFGKQFEKWDDPEVFQPWFDGIIEEVEDELRREAMQRKNDGPRLYEQDERGPRKGEGNRRA